MNLAIKRMAKSVMSWKKRTLLKLKMTGWFYHNFIFLKCNLRSSHNDSSVMLKNDLVSKYPNEDKTFVEKEQKTQCFLFVLLISHIVCVLPINIFKYYCSTIPEFLSFIELTGWRSVLWSIHPWHQRWMWLMLSSSGFHFCLHLQLLWCFFPGLRKGGDYAFRFNYVLIVWWTS